MDFVSQLWVPIVVSAVLVWIASSVIHMALPIHKGEFEGLPDEAKFNAAIEGVKPGQYMFPWCTMAEMKSPEFQEKMRKGPTGHLTIAAGPMNFGRNLMLTLLLYLVIGVFVAYIGHHTLGAGSPYLTVFRVCGTAAFMAYGLGWMPNMIWFGGKSRCFWTYLFDSIVYALLTAGVFGWLWPK
jgi:hypothetical protein